MLIFFHEIYSHPADIRPLISIATHHIQIPVKGDYIICGKKKTDGTYT